MRLSVAVFFATLCVALVVGGLLLVPEPDGAGPVPHPTIPGMQHSGAPDGVRQSTPVLVLGWAFGAAMTVLFALVMAFGVRKGGSLRGLGRPLVVVTLLNLVVWTLLVVAYRRYLGGGGRTLFLAMPVPSAVMLYLFFPMNALFNLLFVVGYERWVLSPEDWRDYRDLARGRGEREEPAKG